MIELQGSVGELRFAVEVTRKETGAVEKYEMVGMIDEDKLKALQEAGMLPKTGE